MKKSLSYALMLAATLGLAACDKASENKQQDAQEHANDAQKLRNDAAKEQSEAVKDANEANQKRAEEAADHNQTPPPAAPAPAPAPQTNQ